jgi:hypothetical protein
MSNIVFEHEDAGRIEVRHPGWADFKSWADEFARDATRQDSYQNLWATLAVSPPAAEVPALIEDFSALPVMVANELLTDCGTPAPGFAGLSERYPVVPDDQVPEEVRQAARKRSRRAFFVQTPAGLFALRPPGAEASSDYTAATSAYHSGAKDSSVAEACRALVTACALSPEPAAVKAAIEEYPAIAWCLAPELIDRAGAGKALVRDS